MLRIASLVAILVVLVKAVVVEHRTIWESHIQPLAKRLETCTSPGIRNPSATGPGSTVCDTSQTCCYGGNAVTCIPLDATCCTFINAGGWCPSGRACAAALNYIPGGSSCVVPYTPPASVYITVAPTSTQPVASSPSPTKSSSSSGLTTASIAGIAVSIVCSVLGLLFGIGFKIWKHKRKEQKEREQVAASAPLARSKKKGTEAT